MPMRKVPLEPQELSVEGINRAVKVYSNYSAMNKIKQLIQLASSLKKCFLLKYSHVNSKKIKDRKI